MPLREIVGNSCSSVWQRRHEEFCTTPRMGSSKLPLNCFTGSCSASSLAVRKKKGPGLVWHCSQLAPACAERSSALTDAFMLWQRPQNAVLDVETRAKPVRTRKAVTTTAV